jgi:hypothetical protein
VEISPEKPGVKSTKKTGQKIVERNNVPTIVTVEILPLMRSTSRRSGSELDG